MLSGRLAQERLDIGGIAADLMDGRLDGSRRYVEHERPEREIVRVFGVNAGDTMVVMAHGPGPIFWMNPNLPTVSSKQH